MKKPIARQVWVIRDPRNAGRDYVLDAKRADELIAEGRLYFCRTNGAPCTPNPDDPIIK